MGMRISRKHLEAKVETINHMTSQPTTGWIRKADGSLRANIGHYTICSHSPGDRYGTRYSLEQIMNESGGVHTVIPTVCGAENFDDCLYAFMQGLVAKQQEWDQHKVA